MIFQGCLHLSHKKYPFASWLKSLKILLKVRQKHDSVDAFLVYFHSMYIWVSLEFQIFYSAILLRDKIFFNHVMVCFPLNYPNILSFWISTIILEFLCFIICVKAAKSWDLSWRWASKIVGCLCHTSVACRSICRSFSCDKRPDRPVCFWERWNWVCRIQ